MGRKKLEEWQKMPGKVYYIRVSNDLNEFLLTHPNRSKYINSLIREDMEKKG